MPAPRTPHPSTDPPAATPDSGRAGTTGAAPIGAIPASRIGGLDIARGIAVLGTLGTNIWLFTHPAGMLGSLTDPFVGLSPGFETLAYQLLTTLTNGKFLALLMMMFGIGVSLQYAAWQRRTRHTTASSHPSGTARSDNGSPENTGKQPRWLRTYAPRAALLFVDGLVNFVLIAEFDILMGYAFTGFVVAAIIASSPRTARLWAWIAGAVHTCVILAMSASLLLFPDAAGSADADASPADWPLWNDINPYREAGFLELALFRLDNTLVFRAEPVFTFTLGICLFLVGARLHAAGVFTEHGSRTRRRCMVLGACAVPADLALGLVGTPAAVLTQRYLTATLVAVGLLALIGHLTAPRAADADTVRVRLPGARVFGAVGRMSLTCYVGQNLVAGALFYGWGLDIAGRFPDHRLLLSVGGFAVVLAIMVAFILTWQRWVTGPARRGPLEWLSHAALERLR